MSRGEPNFDPRHATFFRSDDFDVATSVVREAIQNSLDAAATDRVRVRFAMATCESGRTEAMCTDSYWDHLKACGHDPAGLLRNPMTFLVIEDFGTRGLEGDPRYCGVGDVEEGGADSRKNDFFHLFRNIGISEKTGSQRGRWGLGKSVYSNTSRMGAFWGFTRRRSDGRTLLMGLAELKTHELRGDRYRPHAYWGERSRDGLVLPTEDPVVLSQFASAFGLHRAPRGNHEDNGLSVIIPYPDGEVTPASILRAIVSSYFYPILCGTLDVVVENMDSDEYYEVNDRTLLSHAERLDRKARKSTRALIELGRWYHEHGRNPTLLVPAPQDGSAPKLRRDAIPADVASAVRERLDAGHRVAVTFSLRIGWTDGASRDGAFDVVLERTEESDHGDGVYIRQGITIPNTKVRRPPGVRWILIADDEVVGTFLGDAENPAHTEWNRNLEPFRSRYRYHSATLSYIRKAPLALLALVSHADQAIDRDLLRAIFYLPSKGDATIRTAGPGESPRDTPRATPPGNVHVDSPPRELSLSAVQGGFAVRNTDVVLVGRSILIEAAYEVISGNAFSHYSPHDFDFARPGGLQVTTRGVVVTRAEANRMLIRPREDEFEVVVRGFDVHRDLRVKVEIGEDQA